MRKRIKQLARGKFEYAKPEIVLSEEDIAFTVIEGEDYEGSFTIENPKGMKLRGIVYATNPRMEVLTPQFEGEQVRIRYQFKSFGLNEGLTEKGDFVIICKTGRFVIARSSDKYSCRTTSNVAAVNLSIRRARVN